MRARRFAIGLAAILVVTAISPARAQEATKGEIRGVVKDSGGGVLPGVTVTAVNEQTRETRTTVSTETGLYRLPALSVGGYTITAELQGFGTVKHSGVTVSLGQAATVDLALGVGGISESLTVTGEAPLVDATKTEVAGLLQPAQILNLPLMGRNWMELGFMMPGVTSTVIHPRGVATGRGDNWSQNVIIDGVDSREECCNRSNGTHSQEAISEFKIISNNFPAEYGRSTSSIMTAVTKSGTNAVHGTGFYLFRNENLDKPDFFTHIAEPLTYYQTGGSVGGPILKDRAFFFGAFERQFDSRTGFSTTGFPQLDSYKVPLRAWQNYALAKVDVQFRGNQHLSAKYYYWHQDDLNGSVVSSRGVEGRSTPWSTSDRLMTNAGVAVNHTVAGQKWLNELTFGWVALDWTWGGKKGIPVPGGFTNPGLKIPALTTPSFNMGYFTALQDPAYEYKYQFKNNVSHFFNWHGDHGLKLGVDAIFGWMNIGWFLNSEAGSLTFLRDPTDPFNFSTYPEPTRFQMGVGRPGVSCPDNVSADAKSAFDRTGSCAWYFPVHNFIYAGFIQDNWNVNHRLNVNLGVRYEIETGARVPDYLEQYQPQLDPQIPNPTRSDRNNVGPRLGVTYNLLGDGKTLLRGGGGVSYGSFNFNRTFNKLTKDGWNTIVADQPFPTRQSCFQGHTLEEAITQNPRLLLPGCGTLSFDQLYAGANKAIGTIDPSFQLDRVVQATAGLTHQISADLAFATDFVYSMTGPDRVETDTNLFFDPATGGPKDPRIYGRPDPRFAAISTQQSWGESNYKSLQFTVNKRLRQHYQYQVNYMLSSSRDNIPAGSGAGQPDNPFDHGEWGPSENSATHRLSVNGTVSDLPFGLQVSAVFLAYSGISYDNRVQGDFWNLGRSTSRAYRAAGGTIVKLARNSNVGDHFAKLDMRIAKWFKFGPERQIGVIAEFFNLLNRTNYGSYGNVLGSRTYQQPLRNPSNQFAPRQTQLGVRLAF